MNSDTGKVIIFIGLALIVVGVVIYFFHDKLHWIGRLPGDIRVEKENVRFYFPVTTLILFSPVDQRSYCIDKEVLINNPQTQPRSLRGID